MSNRERKHLQRVEKNDKIREKAERKKKEEEVEQQLQQIEMIADRGSLRI